MPQSINGVLLQTQASHSGTRVKLPGVIQLAAQTAPALSQGVSRARIRGTLPSPLDVSVRAPPGAPSAHPPKCKVRDEQRQVLLGYYYYQVLSRLGYLSLLFRAQRPLPLDGSRVARIVLLHRSCRGSVPARRQQGQRSQMMIPHPP